MSGISDKAFNVFVPNPTWSGVFPEDAQMPLSVVATTDALALERQLASQAATIERLMAALAVYANEANWTGGEWTPLNVWLGVDGENNDGPALAAASLGCSEGEQGNEL